MFVNNAWQIATKSFSMWASYLGIIAMAWPEIRYRKWEIDSDPYLLWYVGMALLIAGTFGRVLNQGISDDSKASKLLTRALWLAIGVIIATLAMGTGPSWAMGATPPSSITAAQDDALDNVVKVSTSDDFLGVVIPLVAQWEGKRNNAYQDIVGVWTICYGHTKDVFSGQHMSDRQCTALLATEIVEYQHRLHTHFTSETIRLRLPATRDAAYTSLAYNVGTRAAGKSTATRRLNAGDIAGGCTALTWWNRAGGRVVRGLQNRRAEEYELCMLN